MLRCTGLARADDIFIDPIVTVIVYAVTHLIGALSRGQADELSVLTDEATGATRTWRVALALVSSRDLFVGVSIAIVVDAIADLCFRLSVTEIADVA